MSQQVVIRDISPVEVVRQLESQLTRSESDQRPVVLILCGIAGSGKTTLAKEVLKVLPHFLRLSNDEIIAARHGLYNFDYEPDKYEEYQEEADGLFVQELRETLIDGRVDIILDRSFYAKEDRDSFKALVEQYGARWVLVHFKVSSELLWQRICERRKKAVDANSALEISKELFEKYVQGFEHPDGEGQFVVEQTNQSLNGIRILEGEYVGNE